MGEGVLLSLGNRAIAKLGVLAMFAFLINSPDALAQEINPAPRLDASTRWTPRAPAPAIKPNQIPKQIRLAPARVDGGTPLLRSEQPEANRVNSSGARQAPNAKIQPERPRPVIRNSAGGINSTEGPETARRGSAPASDERDLSEPISFGQPPKVTEPSEDLD